MSVNSDQHGPDIPAQGPAAKPGEPGYAYAPGWKGRAAQFLDHHGDPDWRRFFRFHSTIVSLFWVAMTGLWVALPAFQSWLLPVPFAILCMAFPMVLFIARLTKQPGLDK